MNLASLLWTSFTRDDGFWDLFLQKPAQEKIFYLGGAPLDDAYDIRFALFRKADGRIKEAFTNSIPITFPFSSISISISPSISSIVIADICRSERMPGCTVAR